MSHGRVYVGWGLAALLAGCDASSGSAADRATAIPARLPATVEGVLAADVSEGDVDARGYAEFNTGSLTVGREELLVEVSGRVLRDADIPPEGGAMPVRATLGSKKQEYGADFYTITALERID